MVKKIGILGGGQLGRMFLQEARSFPFSFYVLDPDPDAPAAVLADGFTCGSFRDYEQVMQFGKNVDILTIEIEDVNTRALFDLRSMGVKVFPEPEVIELLTLVPHSLRQARGHGFGAHHGVAIHGAADD